MQDDYGRSFESSVEEMHRFSLFRDNLKIVRSSNSSAHQMGVTEFADWTNAEFRDKMLTPISISMSMAYSKTDDTEPFEDEEPESVDWRLNGTVTDVRKSPPWTDASITAVVESVEGQYARKHGQLIRLSTQQAVDCMLLPDRSTVIEVYKYFVRDNVGIASEADYPDHEPTSCQFDESKSLDRCKGHVTLQGGREDIVIKYVKSDGPLVAVMDASDPAFQMYKSGIFSSKTCGKTSVNHVVLIIGYGTEGGQAYWLVKNSWGKGWGEEGYFRIARNKANMCGIATHVTRPILVE